MKRSEHIADLSRDHHLGLLFCWKIRQGLNNQVALNRIGDYIQFFWETNLRPHFETEEKLLFVFKDDALTRAALLEHTRIRESVGAIVSGNANTADDYASLALMIERHIRFEEREVFPHLENVFTPRQLQTIGQTLMAVARQQDNYDDEFWAIK